MRHLEVGDKVVWNSWDNDAISKGAYPLNSGNPTFRY